MVSAMTTWARDTIVSGDRVEIAAPEDQARDLGDRDLPPASRATIREHLDDPCACFIGYLTSCEPHGDVRMRSIDVDGDDDGDYAMATGAVTIVEWDSAYLASLAALGRLSGVQGSPPESRDPAT